MKRTILSGIPILLLVVPALAQSTPPAILNYQGVLLSNTSAPENGDRDMTFHFFDDLDPTLPENEIVVESHLLGMGGPVAVVNGMFNVQIGTGIVTDGTGPNPGDGPYLDLSRAFRDYSQVYLEVRVRVGPAGGTGAIETLKPRTRIVSSPYALNSHRLEGIAANQFLRSDVGGTMTGKIQMDTGAATDSIIKEDGISRTSPLAETFDIQNFGGGSMTLRVQGNPAWTAGNDGAGSGLDADLLDGSQATSFLNTSSSAQTKVGDLAVGNLTVNGSNLAFSAGTSMISTAASLTVAAGDADSDDLFISGGNNLADGGLALFGDGAFELTSGDGSFSFRNGATGIETAVLSSVGDLQVDGDITASGDDIRFGSGPKLTASPTELTVLGGSSSTDNLILSAGGASVGSKVSIFGNGSIDIAPGNDTINLYTAHGFLSYTTTLRLGNTAAITTIVNGTNNEVTIDPGGVSDLHLGNSPGDDVLIPGTLTVSGAKAFVQNHPYKHDLSIVYNCLEGDEAGTYTRGSARLTGGVARAPLGETFAWVTNPDIGLTAHVTPRGRPSELYVESVSPTELVVRSGGSSSDDAVFDYVVYGLRIGYEKSRIVREKVMESTVPTDASYERELARTPDLGRYSPMEKFQKMEAEVRGASITNFRASAELRRAIGEHDTEVDDPAERAGDLTTSGIGESTGKTPLSRGEGARPVNPPAGTGVMAHSENTIEEHGMPPVDDQADVYAQFFSPDSTELATSVAVSEAVEPGDVLVMDRESPGLMRLGRLKADRSVVGIVSGAQALLVGGGSHLTSPDRSPLAEVPVAFSGIVLCKADADQGAIEAGDLLTTSPTPGHAMRAENPATGTVVGKALEPLDSGTGLIRVLVMLR